MGVLLLAWLVSPEVLLVLVRRNSAIMRLAGLRAVVRMRRMRKGLRPKDVA